MKIRLCNLIGKIRKYHFRSVFFVNFIMILSMILAFVIVAGGIFVFFNMKNIEDEYTNNAINDSKRVADTLNEYITDARKTVANFIIDADVVWFMSNYDGINSDVMLENRIISKMYSNRNFASYIESIYIYSAQKKCVISEEGVYSTDRFADMGWVVNEDLAEQKRIMIVPRVYNENNLLTVVGKYNVGGINKGNVVVNINVSMMRDEILKKFPQIRARISDQGIVIFSTVVEEFMQQSEYVADNSEKRAVIDGKTYIECTYNLGGTKDVNLETVIWIPLKNYNDIQKNMTVSSLVFIFIFILFGVGISVIFAGYTSTPISNLNDLLEKYEKQEVDREYKEIDNITRIIMNLIDDNELLKSELDRKMTEYKRLELVLLQGQINPHYINNTLGAISLDAGMKYGFDNNVIKMINVLSSSLRYSFASNKISTMINNEVQFLNEYITILKTSNTLKDI